MLSNKAAFALAVVCGVGVALSISFGLLPVIGLTVGATIMFGVVAGAVGAGGVLFGIGGTWLVVGGSTYTRCLARVPDCDPGEGFIPFLGFAAIVAITGALLATVGAARRKHPKQGSHHLT